MQGRRLPRVVFVSVLASASVGSAVLAACVGDEPSAVATVLPVDGGDEATALDASDGSTASDGPSDAAVRPTVDSVTAGNAFGCAVLSDKTAMCWGRNDLGQTAQGAAGDVVCGSNACRPPTRVPGLANVLAVAAGRSSACAIAGGDVYCWGENTHGQLGHANAADPSCPGALPCSATPTKVAGVTNAVEIAVGGSSACAIDMAQNVTCWGSNLSGQLGRGTHDTDNLAPGAWAFDAGAKHIAAGTDPVGHFCAIRTDGTLWCWGSNGNGELGIAPMTAPSISCNAAVANERCVPSPMQVKQNGTAFTAVDSIAAAASATCVSLIGGDVWCWGYNGYAVGGPPVLPRVPSPPALASKGLGGLAGSYSNVCAVGSGGATKCWGLNQYGELGVSPAATPDSGCAGDELCSFPVVTAGTLRAKQVAANANASFAVTPEGKLFGWGASGSGALGHPPTAAESNGQCPSPCSPVPVEIAVP